jgi:hypothetical protein
MNVENWSKNWRSNDEDYDKGDLKDELKSAGFTDCVANLIADNVDKIAEGEWSQKLARQEAVRHIYSFMESNREALDRYEEKVGVSRETIGTTSSTY